MYTKHRQKKSPNIPTECGRSLIFLSLLLLNSLLQTVTGDPRDQGATRGQAVVPYWVSAGRARQEVMSQDPPPPRGDILLVAENQEQLLLLHVERNHDLLAQSFSETHYSGDGVPVTLVPNHTEHCYYHGHVGGHKDSWVVLSTCSGVRGLIVLNTNDSYYLEPVSELESAQHTIYRTEHLPIKGGTCGYGHQMKYPDHLSALFIPLRQRVKRQATGTTKYMELYVVADHTLFRKQNGDLGRTKQRIMEIANYVDKFYRALNIRVPLIGLEVWTERDQCIVSEDPNATLWSFLQWRQKLKSRKKHDNAQLLTGVIFKGTTIGMAPLEGMCSPENSGGINVDHSDMPIGAAATMAHEIGHNFGMSHDNEGCCVEATPEQGGCVMAAATGHPFPRVFSRCSKRDLDSYFQRGGGVCLFNMPNMKDLVGGTRCGNGFVEPGEQCDCGEPEECSNVCCNANNCTLAGGAQCAHGVCCQDCKLKEAGTLCRDAAGSCDLPEYCTGGSSYCPSNVYLFDGSPCQGGHAYCYNGMCLTHEQQCLQLWGHGARPAHDACFQDVNAAGDAFGNCGKDRHRNYVKCDKSDAKCGKIQCLSVARKPKGSNAVSIDNTIRTNGKEVRCRGTYIHANDEGEGDLADPGLVMTGTKCGEGKVCRERRCQNMSLSELQNCLARCHNHGVCNSNHNCHCHPGWAPPFCNKTGLGGSVDSGPLQYHSQKGLVVGLFLVFLLVLPAVLILFWCWKVKTSHLHRWLAQWDIRRQASDPMVTNGQQKLGCCCKFLRFQSQSGQTKVPHTTEETLLESGRREHVSPTQLTRPAPCTPTLPGSSSPCPSPAGKRPPFPSPVQTVSSSQRPLHVSPARGAPLGSRQARSPLSPPERPPPPNFSPARTRGPLSKPGSSALATAQSPAKLKSEAKVSAISAAGPSRFVLKGGPSRDSPAVRK